MNPEASSIPELIRWSTTTFADRDAIHDGAVRLTYTELGSAIDRAARAMVASGVGAGDTVAIWAPNCWQWVVAGLGAIRAGSRLVPVNTRFKGNEAAYVLDKASVRLLFVVDGFLGGLKEKADLAAHGRRLGEQLGCAQQAGHVCVVAAGVHHTLNLRGKR